MTALRMEMRKESPEREHSPERLKALTTALRFGHRRVLDDKEIAQRYQSGQTLMRIAAGFGTTFSTIAKRLRSMGIPRRRRGAKTAHRCACGKPSHKRMIQGSARGGRCAFHTRLAAAEHARTYQKRLRAQKQRESYQRKVRSAA